MSASVAPYLPDATLTAGPKRGKADDAYRTISEVADELHVAQHVLRFWESKFKQIDPLKRAGGRRYYRRDDVDLLKRIHYLLYNQGYTIKGVQKLLVKDRQLLHAVPAITPKDTSASASWIAPPVAPTAANISVADAEPVVVDASTDPLNLFTASDRILLSDVLRRLKLVRDTLHA